MRRILDGRIQAVPHVSAVVPPSPSSRIGAEHRVAAGAEDQVDARGCHPLDEVALRAVTTIDTAIAPVRGQHLVEPRTSLMSAGVTGLPSDVSSPSDATRNSSVVPFRSLAEHADRKVQTTVAT